MSDLTIDLTKYRPSGWGVTISDVATGHSVGHVIVRRWPTGREQMQIIRPAVALDSAVLAAVLLAIRRLPADASYADALEAAEVALEAALHQRGGIAL